MEKLVESRNIDVLRPTLLWVDGRCYRVNVAEEISPNHHEEEFHQDENFASDPPCDVNFEIEKLDRGHVRTRLKVPSFYFRHLLGPKGATKKRIEFETKVQIQIPKFGTEGDIVITGPNERNLSSARTRIEVIVNSARQRQPFTHFLSIPFTSIRSSFVEFRQQVLRKCEGTRGIVESIFQNEDKLHLTIGTMPLLDQSEREKATKVLDECSSLVKNILNDEPLMVRVEGIEYMNDDPGQVDVLYAKLKDICKYKLQLLADQLVNRFVEEGLMQRQHESVKLHVTVMNSLFRKDNCGVCELNSTWRNVNRESFDATPVLKLFRDYDFGQVHLTSVHLSQRHSVARNGFYSSSGRLNLPVLPSPIRGE